MRREEITGAIPLLDGAGRLTRPGVATRPYPVYDHRRVRAGLDAVRGWDRYLAVGEDCALLLELAEEGPLGRMTLRLVDAEAGLNLSQSRRTMTLGLAGLPDDSREGDVVMADRGWSILFRSLGGGRRTLTAHADYFHGGEALDLHLVITGEPEHSAVVCTPCQGEGHFSYTRTVPCLRVEGEAVLGSRTCRFHSRRDFAALDWCRGAWSERESWTAATLCTRVEGQDFALMLCDGPVPGRAALGNAALWGEELHWLEDVTLYCPPDGERWGFATADGDLQAELTPVGQRGDLTLARACGVLRWKPGKVIPFANVLTCVERRR